jgi:hypothetical protein
VGSISLEVVLEISRRGFTTATMFRGQKVNF